MTLAAAFLLGTLTALVIALVLGSRDDPPAPEPIPVRVDEERRHRR